MSEKAAVFPLGAVIRRIIIKTRCVGTSFQTVDTPTHRKNADKSSDTKLKQDK